MHNRTQANGPLEHGGRLREASQHYGIALEQWLDLSTGISPWHYPYSDPSAASWQRLPESGDGLTQTASHYYGSDSLLALPGSQAAISLLPLLRAASRVLILGPTYNEHGHAWRQAGHRVTMCDRLPEGEQLANTDVLLVVNPNNPTGRLLEPGRLMAWYQQLPSRSWMIVDEAFVDSRPGFSLLSAQADLCSSRILVLRSLGKFFGLAGARVGFALGSAQLLNLLEQKVTGLFGDWPVSGPAREVAIQALSDRNWQQQQRSRLTDSGQRLANLLSRVGHSADGKSDFFCWLKTEHAIHWQQFLASQAIWCRRFDDPSAIRFGLPATEQQWQRLETGLAALFSIPGGLIRSQSKINNAQNKAELSA